MVDDAKAHHLVGKQHRVREFLVGDRESNQLRLQMTKRGSFVGASPCQGTFSVLYAEC
jgi:hypothetical protein